MKTALGFLVAFAIGIACRLTDVPLPAPPVLLGALLVATMTAGYVLTDRFMARRAAAPRDNAR
ncbi:MAG TPA: DUF1427 family protein [Gammaproteobacteria bacterium]|nr:DUF1427 family protein [Gammaproteobacteria bacterium]